jgi:exodeoxyribonuclease VII large subunit
MEERKIAEEHYPWTEPWSSAPSREVYTVTELTSRIRLILEIEFSDIWVEGEISNLRTPSSGHTYFTLKDEASQIRAVLFKSQKRSLQFKLEDGLKVLARGRVSVYEPRGEYQIIVDYLEPKGLGALQLAFQQLKEKLDREGLFDPLHKKPIPLLPQKIGIVTSSTGAAIRDILRVIQRRFANVHLILYPTRVQGEGAAQEIAEGIRVLNQFDDIDVLIVGRGGGSIEDLWAFNEEEVARAIFASRIPIISAVGHEIDFTIADFVADLRAPTPSAAAELVVRNKEDLLTQLHTYQGRLRNHIIHYLNFLRERLYHLHQRKGFAIPKENIQYYQQRIDELLVRSTQALSIQLKNRKEYLGHLYQRYYSRSPRERILHVKATLQSYLKSLTNQTLYQLTVRKKSLERLAGQLNSLSPLAILERGYSICRQIPSGEIIKEAEEVSQGQRVSVKLYQGELFCTVEETQPDKGKDGNARDKI